MRAALHPRLRRPRAELGGERVFCNPPYGRAMGAWVRKCHEESHHAFIVLLMPARTDTRYFHDFIYKQPRVRIEFLRGRLRFEKEGNAMGPAPFPSMLVFFNEERLREETM